MKNKKIGFVFTGAFYTIQNTIKQMKKLKELDAYILPIMSENCYNFLNVNKKEFILEIEEITQNKVINTIKEAEKIGRKQLTDILIIAPATGNTISKLACDIIDTTATMAAKAHLRNNLPIVIAPCTNNGLRSRYGKHSKTFK